MVGRTKASYINAGVAALHVEDQVKLNAVDISANRALVDEAEYLSRIELGIARTDALPELGYDASVERLKKAVDAGDDVAFLEGVRSVYEAKRFCTDMGEVPCL